MSAIDIMRLGLKLLTAMLSGLVCDSASVQQKQAPGAIFRNCPTCPEMVTIALGSFTMGQADYS